MYPWKSTRDQNDSAWTWCRRPDHQRFMRQPLATSCVGLAQGCNLLASAVFFGAYLCSDRLSCESLFGRPCQIQTDNYTPSSCVASANWSTSAGVDVRNSQCLGMLGRENSATATTIPFMLWRTCKLLPKISTANVKMVGAFCTAIGDSCRLP